MRRLWTFVVNYCRGLYVRCWLLSIVQFVNGRARIVAPCGVKTEGKDWEKSSLSHETNDF